MFTENGKKSRNKEINNYINVSVAVETVVENIRYVYGCRDCEKNETTTPIVTVPMPKHALPGIIASPETMAYIMTHKYLLHQLLIGCKAIGDFGWRGKQPICSGQGY